jgi:hypothetical protein
MLLKGGVFSTLSHSGKVHDTTRVGLPCRYSPPSPSTLTDATAGGWMIHITGRLGVEPLEERYLPAPTAAISGLGMENPTSLTAIVKSAGVADTIIRLNNSLPGTPLSQSSSIPTQASHDDSEYSTSAAGTTSPSPDSTPATPSGTTADQSSGVSKYTAPGTDTYATTGTSKTTASEYNSTGAGTSTQYGTQTSAQDGQDEYKTPENSTSQQPQTSAAYSEMDFPIQQNPALIEGGATENPVNGHAIASVIPNAIVLPPIAAGPTASVLPSGGIALAAPFSPQTTDADPPVGGGNQEMTSIDSGHPAIHPQETTDYFTLPDVFAIRVDPAIVNQTIDQFLAGLDAIIHDPFDQSDQESLWVRLGYWVIAISGTAVGFELIRQDLRSRQTTEVDIRSLKVPLPQ